MLVVLSPAKSLDFSPIEDYTYSQPRLLDKSEQLVKVLKKKSVRSLRKLMNVSENIADLNAQRYRLFEVPFGPENAKPCLYAFDGDVYLGLDAGSFEARDIDFAQKHLRILSGLYGVLKPMDLMQPYRLEMGTRLKFRKYNNLYDFWGTTITETINEDLEENGDDIVLNLASKEYFKAVDPGLLNGRIVQVDFKENRNGELKFITYNAKKARGRMAHLIVTERITRPEDLKDLHVDGYRFSPAHSDESGFLFVKG